MRSYLKKLNYCFYLITFVGLSFLFASPVSATYTASLSANESVTLNASAVGNGVNVQDESLTVTTNCQAGYNLTISTTTDATLYLNGDSSSSTSTIDPIDNAYALSDLNHNANTWGYSLSGNTSTAGAFNPLSTSPSPIKTTTETASESDIEDTFSIYYGTAINTNLNSGMYTLGDSGTISYYLTVSPSCADTAVITFNENLDGAGAEGTDGTIANFPATSDNTIDATNNTITLSNKRPTRTGYIFQEWNTAADGTGNYYYPNETVSMGQGGLSGFVTLYAIWVADCPATSICYISNHADAGTMTNQPATSNANNILTPSNFNRTGYGFAGWNTEADGTGTNYGPNQTINPGNLSTTGLTLFAHWIKPTGNLQSWSGASSMNIGDVIALRDNRDNEVYAVAKLADNNVWIIENLRLIPKTSIITTNNTNKPTTGFLSNYTNSSSSNMCADDDATCDDSVQYNVNNIDRTLTASLTNNDNASSWYSFGVMYNWYTATAGNGTYGKSSGSVTGDLCPAGWHMPTGGSSGEWNTLNTAINNGYTNKDPGLRTYPANFIWSGDYNPSNVGGTGRGTQARYWSTTAKDAKNAYRMGFSSSTVTATANSWNKWDGFAIRCIYQGSNVPVKDVTVNFAGTGIKSVTFENNDYGNDIATPTNPTVSLALNATYVITATANAGYELSSWATTSGATLASTTANPTSFTVMDEATLTATGAEIPSYTVTVNLGEHVTGVSFINANFGTQSVTTATGSVSLRRGVEYNLTSSYETGYAIEEWTTSANGILGSTTSAATTYTVSGVATLSVSAQEADEVSYTLIYDAGLGTDAPDSETVSSYDTTHDFIITNSAPIYYGYTFTGWSEISGGTVDYVSGDTITIASAGVATTKTLYAVYEANSCPSGKICYYDNGADVIGGGRNTIADQSVSSNASVNLIPSNYSKFGYGFAGWATDANATPYGPNATITTPDVSSTGLALYAKWIKSTGTLQSWSGCNALTLNSVTALTDDRDNNTYTVAKLADDNCWLMENLRLDPGTATITNQNTHNPTSTFIAQSNASDGASLSANTLCNSDDSSCFDQIQYNSNSTNRSLNQSHTANTNSTAWYSYGTYYNWYTATAGQGTYSTSGNTSVSGDICPKKWRLPTGNSTGEYKALNTAVNGGSTSSDAGLRAYPVNFLWSGDYNNTNRNASYSNGRIWTATAKDNNTAYRVGFAASTVTANNNTFNKWDGFIVRCIYDYSAIDYYDVVVTFPANVTSVSFTNANYGVQTATPQNTTVSLAQGATYTLTATFVNEYGLDSWSNGQNSTIGSTSSNPTTFSITDNSTLTLSVREVPVFNITVNLDAHTTSMSFINSDYPIINVVNNNSNGDGTETATVSLKQGVEYTIAGIFDTANSYTFNSWIATMNGVLGDASSAITTYTITNTTTLSLTSKLKTGATTLVPGQSLNAKMKTLAEGTNKTYYNYSDIIKALRMAESLPVSFVATSANTVSVTGAEKPIYIFFDNTDDAGIMYFYTEAKDIYMNADSSYAFNYLNKLADISALSHWDTSNVVDMSHLLMTASSITNLDALSNWDTSNVTNMSYIFSMPGLIDIDGISNWDTSNVTNLSGAFEGTHNLTDIDALSNWNTSNVTEMKQMFAVDYGLTNIDGVLNWDTSNVTDMGSMFSSATPLADINGVRNWDTSNVTNLSKFVANDTSLTNLNGFSNWNTSNVTDMSYMIESSTSISNIDGVANWDTQNVSRMTYMFAGHNLYQKSALTNIDVLSNWNTGNVTQTDNMFSFGRISSIRGASNWDTKNVVNMNHMFFSNPVSDAPVIANWDVRNVLAHVGDSSSVNKFQAMFDSSPTFTFATRAGTWDAGTYVTNDTVSGNVTVSVNFDEHIDKISFKNNYCQTCLAMDVSASGGSITLERGDAYTVTATVRSGYELALWSPGEHGIISSHDFAINGVSFYASSDTTLTVSSQPETSNVTTTVNLDSHISSVTFRNAKYGAVSTSENGGTVSLKKGATYRVTAAVKPGYEVSFWTTTAGTISNNAGTHTYFTTSSNNTLTVSSTTPASTHTVTVDMDSNVSYVVFTAPNWPTKVAIQNAPTVELRDNTPYTITAYTKTDYKFTSWFTTANGILSSTTTNPTTYTVTDTATLTVTSQVIPTYTITVNIDGNVNSVTFANNNYGSQSVTATGSTITLRHGVPYTVTATTNFGYELASWFTTANGILSSTTTNPTTYTVTDTATLTVTSQVIPTYTITVNMDGNATGVTFTNADYGAQSVTATGSTITLRHGVPYTVTATVASGYKFASWSTTANGILSSTTTNPTTYTVTDTATLTVMSQEECGNTIAANSICYVSNGDNVEGTMGVQTFSSSDTSVTLLASNFSRADFGFAGWSPDSTITNNSKIYGPQENLAITAGQYSTAGLKLYAVWVQSAGNLQGWTGCPNLASGTITALTDQRDGETYAVAKLADGNCWMIENMRLENTNTDNTTGTLAQGYNASFIGLANPESPWASDSRNTIANSLYSIDGSTDKTISGDYQSYRFPRYNNANTPIIVTDRPGNPISNSAVNIPSKASMYSYGNYYTWTAAVADTTASTPNNTSAINTSICPSGWHLPKGGDKSNEANNEFWALIVTGINNGANPANYGSQTQPYYAGSPEGSDISNALRAYPNNFVYSGYIGTGMIYDRGSYGYYWSSTAYNSTSAYYLYLDGSSIYPGTNISTKYFGRSIRCLASGS